MVNLMPGRDREVSVSAVDIPLTGEALRSYFLGREVYRRTAFIIVRNGESAAVLRVAKQSEEPLFSPIVALEILAWPDECIVVRAPDIDTANPTQMARSAVNAPSARCVIVEGRYEHVSFILDPAPIRIEVVDVIPPEPPKLLNQIQRILDVAENLPPIELHPTFVDLRLLARGHSGEAYLFPCRGAGIVAEHGRTAYLDQRPPHDNWTLIGCARSREIYRWFYQEEPEYLETCPRLTAGGRDHLTLTKCCLLEKQILQEGKLVTVPWGATLDEVRDGLEALIRMVEPAWSAA